MNSLSLALSIHINIRFEQDQHIAEKRNRENSPSTLHPPLLTRTQINHALLHPHTIVGTHHTPWGTSTLPNRHPLLPHTRFPSLRAPFFLILPIFNRENSPLRISLLVVMLLLLPVEMVRNYRFPHL